MQIVITIDHEIETEQMIALANVMSAEIDRMLGDKIYSQYPYYANRLASYQRKFTALCQFIEARGIVVSDHVVCPHE